MGELDALSCAACSLSPGGAPGRQGKAPTCLRSSGHCADIWQHFGQLPGRRGAGSHSPSTHLPSPPKEIRKYIGKYSLYWSSETTNQKYNFAFKNLLSQDEETTIDNAHPSPIPFRKSLDPVLADKPKKGRLASTSGRASSSLCWGSLCTPTGE